MYILAEVEKNTGLIRRQVCASSRYDLSPRRSDTFTVELDSKMDSKHYRVSGGLLVARMDNQRVASRYGRRLHRGGNEKQADK